MADPVQDFANAWILAWNEHDLDALAQHYADGVSYYSPFIVHLEGEASGRLQGLDAVRAYWRKALVAYPNLQFTLLRAFAGVGSIVVLYESVNNLYAAETFILDDSGKVREVRCHYTPKAMHSI
jgi:hypothetical protein